MTAYIKEQQILENNSKFKYKGEKMIESGNTELFNTDTSERISYE